MLNDADIETAELNEIARHHAALKRKGICVHGWAKTHPDGTVTCLDCGQVFPDSDAHHDAYDEATM